MTAGMVRDCFVLHGVGLLDGATKGSESRVRCGLINRCGHVRLCERCLLNAPLLVVLAWPVVLFWYRGHAAKSLYGRRLWPVRKYDY
jgi:hypothetical protein